MPPPEPSEANRDLQTIIVHEMRHTLDAAMIKLRHCVDQIDDDQLWWRPSPDANSIGNLLLHISGNLNQWVVAGLGQQHDERDREREFAADRREERETLWHDLNSSVSAAMTVLKSLEEADLLRSYKIQGFEVYGYEALSHSVTHFAGHTHQVILLTRLQLGEDYRFQWHPSHPGPGVPL